MQTDLFKSLDGRDGVVGKSLHLLDQLRCRDNGKPAIRKGTLEYPALVLYIGPVSTKVACRLADETYPVVTALENVPSIAQEIEGGLE